MAETTVPLPNGSEGLPPAAGAGTPPPAAPSFAIPDSFKDKPYLKGIDSMDKVFTMLDGAQTLIGQRPAGIPGEKATPEDWGRFYDAMGRPKTAAEYAFEVDPSVKMDDKVITSTKELMYKHGLTAAQAKGLQKDFDAMAISMAKEKGVELQKQNTDFDKLGTDLFGAERDTVLARAKGLIDTFVPASLKGEVAKLSNENLMVLAGVLNGVHAKYIKTDGAPHGQPGGAAQTSDALRDEARKLMTTPAYLNPMDPNHMSTRTKIDELYRQASGSK